MAQHNPNIVVLGGGTGSFTLLQELKEFTPDITAVVNVTDDGGSTGVLRDEYGTLPPGDIRQCLVALSGNPNARKIFNHRYTEGFMAGHSLGNIILTGLAEIEGDFNSGIKAAAEMLDVTGRVVPVTLGNHRLYMLDGAEKVKGEDVIGHRTIKNKEATVHLQPPAALNPEAHEAILGADIVVAAPGSTYTSLLPLFAVGGMKDALAETKAKKVHIANLVTEPGHTDGWHVADYVKKQEEYIGVGAFNYALYNNVPISPVLLERYAADGEFPVATDAERFDEINALAIGSQLVSSEISAQRPGDTIRRTLIRHDAQEVGRMLMRLYWA